MAQERHAHTTVTNMLLSNGVLFSVFMRRVHMNAYEVHDLGIL